MADEILTQPQGQEPPKTYSQEEVDKLLAEKEALIQEEKNQLAGKLRAEFKEKETKAAEKAKKEAEFAKMSELEKQTAIASQATKELQELQDKIALAEQREETRKLMREKGVPEEFLNSVLVFKDADATKQQIDNFKKLYDDVVKKGIEKGIEERIKAHVPTNGVNVGDKDAFGLSREERLRALRLPTKN